MKRPGCGPQVPGLVGWLLVLAGVGAWDAHPRTQTMSSAFHPGRGNKPGLGYVLLWAYLTLHLLRLIPNHLDPLRRFDMLKSNCPEED